MLTAKTSFKIIQFTDFHYDGSEDINARNNAFQKNILALEKPDFVVFTGDMVSGYMEKREPNPSQWYEKQHLKYINEVVKFGVPHAIVIGNHDVEANLNANDILILDSKVASSYTLKGIVNNENERDYIVPVFSDESGSTVLIFMVFLDSGSYLCEGFPGYGCVTQKQVQWLEVTMEKLMLENPLASFIIYLHIPTFQYLDLVIFHPTFGRYFEKMVGSASKETGFIAALSKLGQNGKRQISVHCGHDHSNDYFGSYNGVNLFYGRKSGYGPYMPPKEILPGARVMQFHSVNQSWSSWVRNEIGGIEFIAQTDSSGAFVLSSGEEGESDVVLFNILIIVMGIFAFVGITLILPRSLRSWKRSRMPQIIQ